MSTTPDIIGLTRELQELEKRAVDAPWTANGAGDIEHHYHDEQYGDSIDSVATSVCDDSDDFIVGIRNAFPAIAAALLERDERVAQLERECGKWKTQAEIAKEQSTAWMAENEKMREAFTRLHELTQSFSSPDQCMVLWGQIGEVVHIARSSFHQS